MNRWTQRTAVAALLAGLLILPFALPAPGSIQTIADPYTALDSYVAPIESLFVSTSELNFPVASMADFGMATGGSGGAGNATGIGFGNDDGMFVTQTGTAGAGAWRSIWLQSSTGTARSLVLSAVPQRFRFQITTVGALTNKTLIVGLGDSTTISTAYEAAGANDGAFFRVDAAGAGVNWFAVTKNGASPAETTTDTGVADVINAGALTDLRTFEIVATSSQITYGVCTGANCQPVVIATHTTNLPNDALIPVWGALTDNATTQAVEVRWFKFASARTNVL